MTGFCESVIYQKGLDPCLIGLIDYKSVFLILLLTFLPLFWGRPSSALIDVIWDEAWPWWIESSQSLLKAWPFILTSNPSANKLTPTPSPVWRNTLIMRDAKQTLKQSSVVTWIVLWNMVALELHWLQTPSCVSPPDIKDTSADVITFLSPSGSCLSVLSSHGPSMDSELFRKWSCQCLIYQTGHTLLVLCLLEFHLICLRDIQYAVKKMSLCQCWVDDGAQRTIQCSTVVPGSLLLNQDVQRATSNNPQGSGDVRSLSAVMLPQSLISSVPLGI